MKLRSDYVSNSSSCSFYIHLDTADDINEFKKIMPQLVNLFDSDIYAGWSSDIFDMTQACTSDELKYDDSAWIRVDCGDDTLENIEKFEDVKYFIEEHLYKFKTYRDDLAHSTFGEDMPEEEHERW